MKPQKHYIQIWIESEDDLPEKEGYYFIKINAGDKYEKGSFGDIEKFDPNDEDDRFSWLHLVDYYLVEVEPKGLTEHTAKLEELVKAQKELIEFYSKNISDNAVFLAVHHCGAKKEDVEKGVQLRKRITELNINLK